MRSEFFLVGPTAVGKSSLAVDVAEKLDAEIVNADAFQIYRGLDILTAKPEAEDQRRVRHHLLSAVGLGEEMSAAKFQRLALAALGEIHARGKRAIIVSGSGLYVKALTHGFDVVSPPNPVLRSDLSALASDQLTRRLLQLDPALAARTDLKNRRRVIRAIEIAEENLRRQSSVIPTEAKRSGGIPMRHLKGLAPGPLEFARDDELLVRGIFLIRNRDDLYARINQRVIAMFGAGLEKEIATSNKIGPTAAQALGLREVQQLLANKISRKNCIAKIQQATRRYAKRQLTWFRHQTNFPQLNLTALSHREASDAITQAIARE